MQMYLYHFITFYNDNRNIQELDQIRTLYLTISKDGYLSNTIFMNYFVK